jgi:stress response protein YsnF
LQVRSGIPRRCVLGHHDQGCASGLAGYEFLRTEIGEEEPVVEKRPVAKEEVRVRKGVVEEDVRREEVDVDGDQTTQR